MKKILILIIIVLVIAIVSFVLFKDNETITNENTNNTDNIVTEQKIILETPSPNEIIKSPLTIRGQALGTWYFEGDFPVKLLDEYNKEITVSFATALEEWMTESFVPFEAVIEFENPTTSKGTLILEKDNPSGLPEHADQLVIPVQF